MFKSCQSFHLADHWSKARWRILFRYRGRHYTSGVGQFLLLDCRFFDSFATLLE